jgi:hypothetical protein
MTFEVFLNFGSLNTPRFAIQCLFSNFVKYFLKSSEVFFNLGSLMETSGK